jgi:hypothetical protein
MAHMMNEREEHNVRTSHRWRKVRAAHFREFPFCEMCRREGQLVAASVVHHIHPVGHDREKMFGTPLMSLCAMHHDRDTQAFEKQGKTRGHKCAIGPTGEPIDPDHPWWKDGAS